MEEPNRRTVQRFRARVGDDSFEINVSADGVEVNDRQQEASLVQIRDHHYSLILDGRSYSLVLTEDSRGDVVVTGLDRQIVVHVQDEKDLLLERFGLQDASADGVREVRAPMPGLVVKILVSEGDQVSAGQGLVVLEAMKMENELSAQADGVVRAVHVDAGEAVSRNALLIEFDA